MEARIMMFVVPEEHPNLTRTAETLATITGGRITVLDTRPYTPDNKTGVINSSTTMEGKRLIQIYIIFYFLHALLKKKLNYLKRISIVEDRF